MRMIDREGARQEGYPEPSPAQGQGGIWCRRESGEQSGGAREPLEM